MNEEDKIIHSIAIFMEMTLDNTDHYVIPDGFPIKATICKGGNRIPLEWMRFEESLDWIIPVLQRIEGMGYKWELGSSKEYPYHYCKVYNINTITKVEGVSTLDAAFGGVVEFIKWYNNEQKISKNRSD